MTVLIMTSCGDKNITFTSEAIIRKVDGFDKNLFELVRNQF